MTSALPESSIIDINLIKVNRDTRQRRTIDVGDLKESIRLRGLLQFPVVRRDSYELVAGERRLTSCQELGWTRIPVRWLDTLDPIETEIVELEENTRRQSVPWPDLVTAYLRIHQLYCERESGWTQGQTQEALGLSKGYLSIVLRVGRDLDEERVAKAGSIQEAYNILQRRDTRNNADALEEALGLVDPVGVISDERPDTDGSALVGGNRPREGGAPTSAQTGSQGSTGEQQIGAEDSPAVKSAAPPPPPEEIQPLSFLDWLAGDAPEGQRPFTFIHCDFPYGINLFDSKQGRGAEPTDGYKDTPETYFELLEAFVKNLDRFCASSAHLLFWFSGKHRAATMKLFRDFAPSFEFYPYDLIWHKSDNAGIAGDHRRHPRHTHETALFAARGRRQILEVVADSWSGPTAKTLHASTKPVPMLAHFFRMTVDENSRVFDPTCGSGTSLRAADAAGAKTLLGLEIDPEAAAIAQRELKQARGLRKLSKSASSSLEALVS